MVPQAPAANHQDLIPLFARQTGKTALYHEVFHGIMQSIQKSGGHRVNLILFCIRAHHSKLDQHPSWMKQWYREVIHYRIMSGNAIWGPNFTFPQ